MLPWVKYTRDSNRSSGPNIRAEAPEVLYSGRDACSTSQAASGKSWLVAMAASDAPANFDEVLWRVDLQAKLLVSERDSHEKHARELERQLQEAHDKNVRAQSQNAELQLELSEAARKQVRSRPSASRLDKPTPDAFCRPQAAAEQQVAAQKQASEDERTRHALALREAFAKRAHLQCARLLKRASAHGSRAAPRPTVSGRARHRECARVAEGALAAGAGNAHAPGAAARARERGGSPQEREGELEQSRPFLPGTPRGALPRCGRPHTREGSSRHSRGRASRGPMFARASAHSSVPQCGHTDRFACAPRCLDVTLS